VQSCSALLKGGLAGLIGLVGWWCGCVVDTGQTRVQQFQGASREAFGERSGVQWSGFSGDTQTQAFAGCTRLTLSGDEDDGDDGGDDDL
jgi:hypothetical protein